MSELEKIISVLPLLDNSGGIDLRCYDVKIFITSQASRIAELEVAVREAVERAMYDCGEAIEGSRIVGGPKSQTDEVYENALTEAQAAIRALPAKEDGNG